MGDCSTLPLQWAAESFLPHVMHAATTNENIVLFQQSKCASPEAQLRSCSGRTWENFWRTGHEPQPSKCKASVSRHPRSCNFDRERLALTHLEPSFELPQQLVSSSISTAAQSVELCIFTFLQLPHLFLFDTWRAIMAAIPFHSLPISPLLFLTLTFLSPIFQHFTFTFSIVAPSLRSH